MVNALLLSYSVMLMLARPFGGVMLSKELIPYNAAGRPIMSTSSEAMFLSQSDLEELTGHARAAIQMRWLRASEIPFIIGGDGKPKVARETLMRRLDSSQEGVPGADPSMPKLAEIVDNWDKVTEELMAEMMGLSARALEGRRAAGKIPDSIWQRVDGRIMYSMRRYEGWLEMLWPAFEHPPETGPSRRAKASKNLKNNGKGPIRWIV